MCGRYTVRRIDARRFGVAFQQEFEEFTERPRMNLCPSVAVPIVKLNDDGRRVLDVAAWGLIPYWSKTRPAKPPFNARAETVASNGVFRQAFAQRRCLIPADEFYEWQGTVKPKPMYSIGLRDDEPFAFAGLWEQWKPADGLETQTCTIITTTPNELLAGIHNRMPVILPPEEYDRWLQTGGVEFLRPFPAGQMRATLISPPPIRESSLFEQ